MGAKSVSTTTLSRCGSGKPKVCASAEPAHEPATSDTSAMRKSPPRVPHAENHDDVVRHSANRPTTVAEASKWSVMLLGVFSYDSMPISQPRGDCPMSMPSAQA